MLVEAEMIDGKKKRIIELIRLNFHMRQMLLYRFLIVAHYWFLKWTEFFIVLLVLYSVRAAIVIMTHFQIRYNYYKLQTNSISIINTHSFYFLIFFSFYLRIIFNWFLTFLLILILTHTFEWVAIANYLYFLCVYKLV